MMEQAMKKKLKEQYKNREMIGGVYCIRCNKADFFWIRATTDINASKNRFVFSVKTNACVEMHIAELWKQHGAAAFTFDVLEELKKTETQTNDAFAKDINTLLELWNEKLKDSRREK